MDENTPRERMLSNIRRAIELGKDLDVTKMHDDGTYVKFIPKITARSKRRGIRPNVDFPVVSKSYERFAHAMYLTEDPVLISYIELFATKNPDLVEEKSTYKPTQGLTNIKRIIDKYNRGTVAFVPPSRLEGNVRFIGSPYGERTIIGDLPKRKIERIQTGWPTVQPTTRRWDYDIYETNFNRNDDDFFLPDNFNNNTRAAGFNRINVDSSLANMSYDDRSELPYQTRITPTRVTPTRVTPTRVTPTRVDPLNIYQDRRYDQNGRYDEGRNDGGRYDDLTRFDQVTRTPSPDRQPLSPLGRPDLLPENNQIVVPDRRINIPGFLDRNREIEEVRTMDDNTRIRESRETGVRGGNDFSTYVPTNIPLMTAKTVVPPRNFASFSLDHEPLSTTPLRTLREARSSPTRSPVQRIALPPVTTTPMILFDDTIPINNTINDVESRRSVLPGLPGHSSPSVTSTPSVSSVVSPAFEQVTTVPERRELRSKLKRQVFSTKEYIPDNSQEMNTMTWLNTKRNQEPIQVSEEYPITPTTFEGAPNTFGGAPSNKRVTFGKNEVRSTLRPLYTEEY